jgi:hypothetical protein
MRKHVIFIIVTILLLTTTASAQTPGQFALTWSAASSGGSISRGHNDDDKFYTLESIVNQPGAGRMGDARYTLTSGHLVAPVPATNLVLLYVNGDNNLDDYIRERLLPRTLAGARNPQVVTLMVLDGPGAADAYLYRLGTSSQERQGDLSCNLFDDHTCQGVYVDGETVWPFDENIADPTTLSDFIIGQMQTYAAQRVMLSLVGHGGGWSPELLAGQPQGHGGKPADELGGLLWDDHNGDPNAKPNEQGNSLSTIDLGVALKKVYDATGRKIDLLYLDACLMGMWEVAYEIRESVHYLLASQSWAWTSFAYDTHLRNLDNEQGIEEIGKRWIAHEIAELAGYPFTYSLIDLTEIGAVKDAVNTLGVALQTTLPGGQERIRGAFLRSACFDSNGDHEINQRDPGQGKGIDNYCDLGSFARQLRELFADTTAVVEATAAVQTAVSNAVKTQEFRCGIPREYSANLWCWSALSGLSIYVPLLQDQWKRSQYYQIQAAKDTAWNEFLDDFWNIPAPTAPACQSCVPLPEGPLPITRQLYLPVVHR